MESGFQKLAIILLLSTVVAVSGCTDSSTPPKTGNNTSDQTASQPEESSRSPDMADETQINVVSFSMPDKVSLSEKYSINLTLKNIGGKKGSERFRLLKRHPDDFTTRLQDLQFNVTLGPGETKKFTFMRQGVETGVSFFDWRTKIAPTEDPSRGWVDSEPIAEQRLNVTVPDLSMGESYVTQWNVSYTVKNLELIYYYKYRSDGEVHKKTPYRINNQYAVATVKFKNVGNSKIETVRSDEFYVVYNGTRYETYTASGAINYKENYAATLKPGESITTDLMFSIPYEAEKQNLTVRYVIEYDSDPSYKHSSQLKKVNWYP
ncbi:DUF4352 domain-containing protein [Candidatus Nanohaloarchaea archaeon]|nr:DUF4352 domain-containing protein [Candidatus Nanohaloarchaea archaeon]